MCQTMKPINLNLPPEAEVYNSLYPTKAPEYLVQDLLSVALPNGHFIDVAWSPEHDPKGEYIVRVFFECWDRQQIPPVVTRCLSDVIRCVEELAVRFGKELWVDEDY